MTHQGAECYSLPWAAVYNRFFALVRGSVCVCREYEGQLRMRYTVQSMKPVEFIAESKRMIEALAKLHVKVEAG